MSLPVYPCLPEPTYIKLDKVESSINVTTENLIVLQSKKQVKFKHTDVIRIRKISKSEQGFFYEIAPNKSKPLQTKVILSVSNKKITLNITLNKREKKRQTEHLTKDFGCGKPSLVEYH